MSLCQLRVVHTLCEGQKDALLAAAAEPLLERLLASLQPAVYVLAEVGIVWCGAGSLDRITPLFWSCLLYTSPSPRDAHES
eukprot:1090075-Prymnesium_polylepis.1